MQNEPNFHKAQNELNPIPEKELRKLFTPPDNEKRTQYEPNTNPIPENAKMNLTPYKKSNYVKYMTFSPKKNEPNPNPIQTQNEPNLPPQAPCFMPGVLPKPQTGVKPNFGGYMRAGGCFLCEKMAAGGGSHGQVLC